MAAGEAEVGPAAKTDHSMIQDGCRFQETGLTQHQRSAERHLINKNISPFFKNEYCRSCPLVQQSTLNAF